MRDGTVDPFDLVSKVGSMVKQELIEVDEIFATSKIIYEGMDVEDTPPTFGAEKTNLELSTFGGESKTLIAKAQPQATPEASGPSPAHSRGDPKSFQLIGLNGSPVAPPMSVMEIRRLAQAKRLDPRLAVMRVGSQSRIPLSRFLAVYGGRPQPYTPPPETRSPLHGWAIAALVGSAMLLAASAWLLFTAPKTDNTPLKGQRTVKVQKRKAKDRKQSRLPKALAAKPPMLQGSYALPKGPLPAAQSQPQPPKTKREKAPVRTVARQAPPPRYVPAPRPNLPPQPPRLAAVKPVSPPPVAPPSKAMTLQDGQSVSRFGPIRFSASALNACGHACQLQAYGPSGKVTLAFFKQAWLQQLSSKSSGVYVSGTIKNGPSGVKILISNVQ